MALTAYRFCEEQGWFDLMEARGEVLAVLEPGEGGWKSAADELSYVNAAMSFIESGKNANGVVLFTNYSTFYFVGYENGAAPLESWAVENPIKVDSQAYVGGVSVGSEYLAEVGSKIYDGTNTGGYDPGIADLDTFKAVLKTQGYDDAITRSDVPVPTWFMGYAAEDAALHTGRMQMTARAPQMTIPSGRTLIPMLSRLCTQIPAWTRRPDMVLHRLR